MSDPEGGSDPVRLQVRRRTADRFFVEEVFSQRAYTPAGYEIAPTDVIVDVGGNIGSFAIYAGRRAKQGKVVCVEPASDNFAILAGNVDRNRLSNVVPIRAAVNGTSGPVVLRHSAVGTGHHSLEPALAGETGRTEEVEGMTLLDLFERHGVVRCDFLKLDCEGAEFPILETASREVLDRIRRIALEYHTRPHGTKRSQADGLVRRLSDAGFVIDRYEDHLGTNRGMIFASRGRRSS